MELFEQLNEQLTRLKNLLVRLTDDQYTFKSKFLSGASIGAHSRHIIELLNCAVAGHAIGLVDYNHRQRNLLLEKDKLIAIQHISVILNSFTLTDKRIELMSGATTTIKSTYYRELAYNLEHVIHHLALIKVSLIEMELNIDDDHFGVAYSTIHYLQTLETQR